MGSSADMTLRRASVLFVLAAAMTLAACGGGSAPRAPGRSEHVAPRSCGGSALGAHAIRFRTTDGVTLAGAVVGSGPVGAVLIHEYPLDLCGFWPYARYLARRGIHVLLLDLRCFGRSACTGGRGHATTDVAAAVAELRRRGARSVALVGASMG